MGRLYHFFDNSVKKLILKTFLQKRLQFYERVCLFPLHLFIVLLFLELFYKILVSIFGPTSCKVQHQGRPGRPFSYARA